MKLFTATSVAISIGLGLCTAPLALADDNSFAGKWKLNPDKGELTGLTYKVGEAGKNQMTFTFGDNTETLMLGKEHTTRTGAVWVISQSGPKTWKWIRKHDGKVTSDATWTVSDDGATSTYATTETRPDGSTSRDTYELKRTEGSGPGLAGTWQSTSIKVGTPDEMEISSWEGNGYTMKNAAYKSATSFKPDGKEYSPKGPQVAKGLLMSAKADGANGMELTYKLKGKTTETDKWELSANGKTLTETITYPGESKAEVDVYERE